VLLLWPTVAVLGFLALAGLVIVLGASSTARYEFERNRLREQPAVAAAEHRPEERLPGRPAAEGAPAAGAAAGAPRQPRAQVGLATHPAGKRTGAPGAAPAWWLVDESDDHPGVQVLAGPFADRLEADWAALAGGTHPSVQVAYGEQRDDGRLLRRQSPEERAWLADLGEQLDRLAEDWDELVSDDDTLTTLVVEVAAALVEAGLAVHDCAGEEPAGGVCLTPEEDRRGVLVGWHQHDRMSLEQVRGPEVDAAVQDRMNAAVAEVLTAMGFGILPFGSTGCALVITAPR
jgi:hypothetical protein